MSVTYRCDHCRHEERFDDGIVGNEFNHYGQSRHANKDKMKNRRGFSTLREVWRIPGVVDVCDDCMEKFQKAAIDAKQTETASVVSRFRSLIGAKP